MTRLFLCLRPLALVLALLHGYVCSAEQLTPASTSLSSSLALSTSMPSLTVSVTSPEISLSTSEPAMAPIHLIPQNTTSDPIGFANVSSYYGPGTWSAWFLTLVASWIRLYRKKVVFDINTWLYLLGMNWAAGDMLIKKRELFRLVADGSGDWMRDCASIGAAYTVVSWGLSHAMCQLCVCSGFNDGLPHKSQRIVTLILGMAFPAMSLSLFLHDFLFSSGIFGYVLIFDYVPTAYWDGMTSDPRFISMVVTAAFGMLSYLLSIVAFLHIASLSLDFISNRMEQLPESAVWKKSRQGVIYLYATFLAVSVVFFARYLPLTFFVMTLYLFFLAYLLILVGGIGIIILSAVYIWMAYITRTTPLSQSCFFMPCAPQSITDSDQAFTLIVAILSLIAMEVGEPLYQKRYARIQFQRDAERDFAMARLRRAGNDDNTAQGSEEAGEAGATGSSILGPRRIDSGIAVEEGRAGTGLARRVRSDLQSQAIHEGLIGS